LKGGSASKGERRRESGGGAERESGGREGRLREKGVGRKRVRLGRGERRDGESGQGAYSTKRADG